MLAILDRTTRSEVILEENRNDLYRYTEGPEARSVARSEKLGRRRFYQETFLDTISLSVGGSGGNKYLDSTAKITSEAHVLKSSGWRLGFPSVCALRSKPREITRNLPRGPDRYVRRM